MEKNKEEKKNSQIGQNNKNLGIKQSQGPLVPPPRSLNNILSHILWAAS